MIKLLKELEENCDLATDGLWKLNVCADESGELLIDDAPIAIFDNKEELNIYVAALVESGKTLTFALILEIIKKVQK